MKRYFSVFLAAALICTAGCSKNDSDGGSPDGPRTIRVATADAALSGSGDYLLGGSVAGIEVAALSRVGVQYMACGEAAALESLDWTSSVWIGAEKPSLSWSVPAENLTPETTYAFRAFAETSGTYCFGSAKSFTTPPSGVEPLPLPLTVAELRAKHAAGEDVSARNVRGYVVLGVTSGPVAGFGPGTILLYDNAGAPASAILLSVEGIADGDFAEGDLLEVSLAGAVRKVYGDVIPQYGGLARNAVKGISRAHAIDPVWVTPAQLIAGPEKYVCAPVRISRVYAVTPGVLFSASGNRFTDGESSFAVCADASGVVGRLTQNSATGSLCGICSFDGEPQVWPLKAADVAAFTGDGGIAEGEPAIEILNTEHYEFAPRGGTRVVDCRVTARAGQRLYADTRNIDASRYSIEIENDRISVSARPNNAGKTDDYANCYIYLADSKEERREAVATIRITQLCSAYESIPALIQANDGELSSVHAAVVNGFTTSAMKLGSGNYTGHYTTDPTGAVGDQKLVFYATGWKEGGHGAGTLYLRVRGGGSASTASVTLKINDGATGQAPFILGVGDTDRYEVSLTGLQPGSVIDFSTSPDFDRKKDDRTGRALLFGVQICD